MQSWGLERCLYKFVHHHQKKAKEYVKKKKNQKIPVISEWVLNNMPPLFGEGLGLHNQFIKKFYERPQSKWKAGKNVLALVI